MTSGEVFALVTGGGTGGHVTPALAIAEALVAAGHPRESIRFVGARRGLESTAVPEAGFAIELLTLDGLQRSLAPRDLLRSVRSLVAFARAFRHCLRLLRRLRPRVVIGVGGYAAAPCVFAARMLRVPTVVHEQNAVPGLVNRIAVRWGARPAVSFPGSRWRRAVTTGNPVRAAVLEVVRTPQTPPLVAVVGGSQGAGKLNAVALDLYDRWRDRSDIAIRHVAGPKHEAGCAQRLTSLVAHGDTIAYELVAYEADMAGLYQRAALMLCRAGATTVAELNAVGIPALYVPWSGSAEGQQQANAAAMVAVGAAVLVADSDCVVDTVEPIVQSLLNDPDRLAVMAAAARAHGRADAAAQVVRLVEEVVGDS